MEKINFLAMTTSQEFEKLTLAELSTISKEDLGSMTDKQLEMFLKAKQSARKAEEKKEKEQLAQIEKQRKEQEEKVLIESYTHKDTKFEINGRFTNGTLYGITDSGKAKSKYPAIENKNLEDLAFTFLTKGKEAMENLILAIGAEITKVREEEKKASELKAKEDKKKIA